MELIGKLSSNDTSNIGMIPSASNDVFIKFSDQCIQIICNKDRLNGLNARRINQNIESLLKYQSRFHNVQSNNDVYHRRIKIQWNNKVFT